MDFAELRARLAEVVAIPVTPFHPTGELDETGHRAVLRRLLDGGIRVLTPNGNTGEFYALTAPETRRILALTVAEAAGQATIVAGVGHAIPDAITAAQHAHRTGADAIMVHQPVHPYQSPAGWLAYHRAIANAVPELGVLLYLRDPRITGATLAELGTATPNVVAVKYAVPDPVRFASVRADTHDSQLVWLAGLAELSAPGYWAAGATGFTSGLANVSPAESISLLTELRANDRPAIEHIWARIRPFEALRAANDSADNVSVVKEALAQLAVCGPDVRPPSSRLDAAGRAAVAAVLASWELAG